MEISLEVDEKVNVTIEGACEFEVWGERNEEGTMVIKHKMKGEDDSWYCEQCGKEMKSSEQGVFFDSVGYCSQECIDERKAQL